VLPLLLLCSGTLSARAQTPALPPAGLSDGIAEPDSPDAVAATGPLRFPAGRHDVTLFVNAVERGRVAARFNARGELCFARGWLEAAGLSAPATLPAGDEVDEADEVDCPSLHAAFPEAGAHAGFALTLQPERDTIRLEVPASALRLPEAPPAGSGKSADAAFDSDILSRRGLDPQIAEYFRDAPRFSPGRTAVNVFVNDIRRGRVNARFNEQGELCFDLALLDTAGLTVPPPRHAGAGSSAAGLCYDYKEAYPGTLISLLPNREEVRLVVPTAALRPAESDFSGYSRGGTAMLLNYDLMGMRSENGGTASHFLSLNTELGLNLRDWILRSRAYTALQDGVFQNRHLYAYAQRTWVDHGATLQAGQINITNSVLTSAPLTGIQVFPDAALARQTRNVVMVEGLAQSQARVEVRQAGALIYSTVVPAGPFSLTDLPLLNGSSDLEVTVIESNGAQRRFTVPAGAINAGSLGQRPGYAFAFGKSRSLDGNSARQPWVASASGNWAVGQRSHFGAGALFASRYQAVSWGVDTRPSRQLSLKLQQRLSHAVLDEGRRGTQLSFSGNAIGLPANFSLSFSSTLQSKGYRTLDDVTQNITDAVASASRYRTQHTAALGWHNTAVGGFTIAYSQSTQHNGGRTQRLNASWGKTFNFGTLSLNVERDLSPRNGTAYASTTPLNAYYLTLSVPLGKRTVRTYASNSGGYTRLGAAYSERVSDTLNYSVSAERNTQRHDNTVAAQLSAVPRYAQVNLGFSATGTDTRSYYGGATGGLVLHAKGLTASPYTVQDTFGIVSAAGMPGVKVGTPQGPVWTDPWGRAVIPQLSAYSGSRVEVDTRTLPRNVDIRNGFRLVDAGRGSVNFVDFDLTRVRRLLLTARDADGRDLPSGAYVLDERKQFISTVLDRGQIFLSSGAADATLTVALPGDKQCVLRYPLPEVPAADAFYETADAVCHPQ